MRIVYAIVYGTTLLGQIPTNFDPSMDVTLSLVYLGVHWFHNHFNIRLTWKEGYRRVQQLKVSVTPSGENSSSAIPQHQ